jgi:TetR/AcrR family transcriptional regulator, transcriptional repressor for nem operon
VLARVRPERKLLEGLIRPALGLLDNTSNARRRQRPASRTR